MPRQSFFNFSQDALNRILGGATPPINTGSARTIPDTVLASNQVGGPVGRPYSFGAPSDQVKIWSDPEGVSHVAYRKMIQDQADQAAALQAQQEAALKAQQQMTATSAQQQSAYAAQQAAAQALAQSQAQAAASAQATVPTIPAATVQPSYQQQRALRQQQRAAAGAQAQPAPSSPVPTVSAPAPAPISTPTSSYIPLQQWSNMQIDASNKAYQAQYPQNTGSHYTWNYVDYGPAGQNTMVDPYTGKSYINGQPAGTTYSWSPYGNTPNPYLTQPVNTSSYTKL